MDRATFFQHFDLLADQPDAVAKMRELVLNLAIRGKLVPQSPKDEPAETLLERIRAARARLHDGGKVKTRVEISPISASAIPYSIPPNWLWVPFNEITELVYGKLLPTTELLGNGYDVFGANGIIGKYSRYHYEDEMLLISCRGAYSGKPNISPRKCYVTNNSIVCEFFDPALCDIRFFHAVIAISPREKIVTGTAQPQVTVANAIKLPVPLPPLAEQRRIVAKVDELMALCDELDQQQQALHDAETLFQRSALHHLTSARDPSSFAASWQRVSNHFDLLHNHPDAITQLRQSILQLAVQGRLVPQNPKDEPAEKLLKRIEAAKRDFLLANKMKLPETPLEIGDDGIPFKCPDGWQWVRLGSISNRIHYGYTASADHSQKAVRLLRITDIQNNRVNWETVPGCQISNDEVAKYELHNGDILIARTGGTIGKTFLVENVDVKAVFASYLIRVIPSSEISAQYLKLFLESPSYWQQLLAKSAGTGQPNVNGEALSGLTISLPPLAEQKRIVARVENLTQQCDTLELQLNDSHTLGTQLLDSTIHHLFVKPEQSDLAANSRGHKR
jgi:type I restriction enzyme, S subunit